MGAALLIAGWRLLAPVSREDMPDLPLVIGPGADRQEAAYQALLAAALGAECPAHRGLAYADDTLFLHQADTTLVVRTPDGR